jgi:integrase
MGLLFAAITRAAHLDPNAQRDYALIKGAYLLGCRVSEIAVIRWRDIEALDDGGQIHLFGKGSKRRTVRISPATLGLFQGLGRGDAEDFVFPSPRRDGHLTRQAIGDVCRKWGRAAGFHVHPHQLRHSHATHAVQRGVDVRTYARFKPRSVTRQARLLGITSQAALGTALLFSLVSSTSR